MRSTWMTTLAAAIALAGCVKMDFFMFESEPATLEDYDFSKESLDGIPESRIRSEMIPTGTAGEQMHVIYVERDVAKLDSRLAPEDDITVVFSHGNSENMLRYWYRVGYFEDMGFNVLMYDYRGYGASDGETTEAHLYEDAEAAYDFAEAMGAGAIFSVGYSLGGVPAIWLCAPESGRRVLGCFTEGAFSSAAQIIEDGAGYDFPAAWFVDFELDNLSRIKTVSVPFMIMHGTDDQRVGYVNGLRLFDAVEKNHPLNRFYSVEGAGHRNVPIPSYDGEDEPREYSHPDEMPSYLREEFEFYKNRVIDLVIESMEK